MQYYRAVLTVEKTIFDPTKVGTYMSINWCTNTPHYKML